MIQMYVAESLEDLRIDRGLNQDSFSGVDQCSHRLRTIQSQSHEVLIAMRP